MTLNAIVLPKWGLAMEEGTLVSWLLAEGATVCVGDEIAEIETSKIANALQSPVAGVLRRRVAQEGDTCRVGAMLGVVADAAEDEAAIDTFVSDFESRFASAAQSLAVEPTAETLEVDGVPIRFLMVRGTNDPLGTPLVLIHGFGGDHLNWMFNQRELAVDRDVYALDLPGHGGSTKDVGDGGFDVLASRVVAWLDRLGLGVVHLVGHSMGAGVALALALRWPDRVKSLTALSGAGLGGELNRLYIEGFIAAGRRKELKPAVDLLFADPDLVTREMLEDLIAYKRIDGVPEALRALSDGALSIEALTALRVRLSDLRTPMLAIFGNRDQVLPMPNTDGLPAKITVIEGAGHMPHIEAAEEVNRQISAFVGKHG
jgi:pyruvate dehydrogenase E2 component (dihydrolipoamide acetyltransferase)